MSLREVKLLGFGLCLVVSFVSSQPVSAQSETPDFIRLWEAPTGRPSESIFTDELPTIVPMGYREASVVSCFDSGLNCDSTTACDGFGRSCFSDLGTRQSFSNGLWGIQPELAKEGIVYQAQLTQFYQGVVSGGQDRTAEYGGKFDQFLIFNSKELGLWEGMQVIMHAETRFGEDIIQDAVLLAPANVNMLYPSLQNETAITGFQITQALSEEWAVTFGKINALDLFYGMYPQTGRGVTGFMNTSMVLPLSVVRTTPLSFLGAGVIRLQEGKFQSGVLVYDSHNSATTSGFDDLFSNGANVLGFWRNFTEIGGRTGSHTFLGSYASGDFTSLDRTGWAVVPGQGVVAPQQSQSWSLNYILEQQLWVDPCHQERNIGLMSCWGLADEKTSPYLWTANVAVQGNGLVPGREGDSLGVGYFYNGVSGDLKNLVPLLNVGNVQGAELYYNAAITPWFQLTADLQVVEPALGARDTAVVAGLRAMIVP